MNWHSKIAQINEIISKWKSTIPTPLCTNSNSKENKNKAFSTALSWNCVCFTVSRWSIENNFGFKTCQESSPGLNWDHFLKLRVTGFAFSVQWPGWRKVWKSGGASSNATRRRWPAANSIQPKSGGAYAPPAPLLPPSLQSTPCAITSRCRKLQNSNV